MYDFIHVHTCAAYIIVCENMCVWICMCVYVYMNICKRRWKCKLFIVLLNILYKLKILIYFKILFPSFLSN